MPGSSFQLVQKLINEFEKTVVVIGSLSDLEYRTPANNTGSVGGHIRHNLDFVKSFLSGIKTGRIDYNNRERDTLVEKNRDYAAEKIAAVVQSAASLVELDLDRMVVVRSELDPNTWYASSLMRELEFVFSHTVHHHALVAEKLSTCGVSISENFGVAPSTLDYWNTLAVS